MRDNAILNAERLSMKVLNYLFPMKNPNDLKVFQSSNSKIRGINFKRNTNVSNYIKNNLGEFSNNYGIYFLKSVADDDLELFIGQSTNGFERIAGHKEKLFWSEGILFITENNSWDKTVIDYLEYKLINIFNKSKYMLLNKDLRAKEPVLDIFQQAQMKDLVNEILFLLASNGIESKETRSNIETSNVYESIRNNNAKLLYENGEFILLKGSELKRPIESSKDWKYKNFYKNTNQKIDDIIDSGKANVDNGKIILSSDIGFSNPSRPAVLTSGCSENGYTYWKGIEEIRK